MSFYVDIFLRQNLNIMFTTSTKCDINKKQSIQHILCFYKFFLIKLLFKIIRIILNLKKFKGKELNENKNIKKKTKVN